MERFRLRKHRGRRPSFDALPAAQRRRAFGVDYAWVRGLQGGELFFTRQGWAIAESLLPEQWFDDERYRRVGRALPGATAAIYHVPIRHPRRSRYGLVVRFSRFAQDVGFTYSDASTRFGWPDERLPAAAFNDPFSEFGLLHQLRQASHGRIRTKHPLLIYCPCTHYESWRLGRDPRRVIAGRHRLALDQEHVTDCPRITLEPERLYILVYQWIDGVDLERAGLDQSLPVEMVETFTREVAQTLLSTGFAVLDHKPRHIILRVNRTGSDWLRRHEEWSWALIDYELLVSVDDALPSDHGANPAP